MARVLDSVAERPGFVALAIGDVLLASALVSSDLTIARFVAGELAAPAPALAQAVDVSLVVALVAATLVLADVVAAFGLPSAGLPSLAPLAPLVIAAVPPLSAALLVLLPPVVLALPAPLTLLAALVATVLTAHVLVFAQLARVCLSSLGLLESSLFGLLVSGASPADVPVLAGFAVLSRALPIGPSGSIAFARSGSALAVVRLLVPGLSVLPSASPPALVLVVSCHNRASVGFHHRIFLMYTGRVLTEGS